MKRFIALLTFTDQGRHDIKKSPARSDAFTKTATAAGCKINALYWTVGAYDGLLSFDAPDEMTATALMIKLGSEGNVSTQTLRAFPRDQFEELLGKATAL